MSSKVWGAVFHCICGAKVEPNLAIWPGWKQVGWMRHLTVHYYLGTMVIFAKNESYC